MLLFSPTPTPPCSFTTRLAPFNVLGKSLVRHEKSLDSWWYVVEDEAMRRLDAVDRYCGLKRDRWVRDGAGSEVMPASLLKCPGTFSVSFLVVVGVCSKCFSKEVLDSTDQCKTIIRNKKSFLFLTEKLYSLEEKLLMRVTNVLWTPETRKNRNKKQMN